MYLIYKSCELVDQLICYLTVSSPLPSYSFSEMTPLVSGENGVDVVLSCSLVQEGAGLDGMRAGFTRTPATLVLRDVRVTPEQSPDTLTPFIPPTLPDPEALLFEAKGLCLKTGNMNIFEKS